MSTSVTQINPHKVAEFKSQILAVGTIWTTQQIKEVECGPCCISLVLRQLNHGGRNTDIATLRQYSQSYPNGYRPTGKSVVGGKPSLLAQVNASSTTASYTGTYGDNMAAVLNGKFYNQQGDRQWRSAPYNTTKELKQWLKARSPADPCICQVTWDNGGSHAIVALGAESTKVTSGPDAGHRRYYFSDPYYGLQWLRIPHESNKTRLTYWPFDMNANQQGPRGYFEKWIVYRV